MDDHSADAYLVNTGWTGGAYGVGSRISIKNTRSIIDAILDGSIEGVNYTESHVFGFLVPTEVPNVDSAILDPKHTWEDKSAYDVNAQKLAAQFKENFKKFGDTLLGQSLAEYGPKG